VSAKSPRPEPSTTAVSGGGPQRLRTAAAASSTRSKVLRILDLAIIDYRIVVDWRLLIESAHRPDEAPGCVFNPKSRINNQQEISNQ
jgi:hypothetical protein